MKSKKPFNCEKLASFSFCVRRGSVRRISQLTTAMAVASAISFGIPEKLLAQDPTKTADVQNLTRSGQLFTVRLQPGEKNLKIYLAGKESAKLDWTNAKLEVNLVKSPEQRTALRVVQRKDHFAIEDALDTNKPTHLEIRAKHKEKTETFDFELQNRPKD